MTRDRITKIWKFRIKALGSSGLSCWKRGVAIRPLYDEKGDLCAVTYTRETDSPVFGRPTYDRS